MDHYVSYQYVMRNSQRKNFFRFPAGSPASIATKQNPKSGEDCGDGVRTGGDMEVETVIGGMDFLVGFTATVVIGSGVITEDSLTGKPGYLSAIPVR